MSTPVTKGFVDDLIITEGFGDSFGFSTSTIQNRIVTRGLGMNRGGVVCRSSAASMGYGGALAAQIVALSEQLVNRRRTGGSGKRREYEHEYEILIGAKVLLVNGIEPSKKIQGYVRVKFEVDRPPHVKLVETSVKTVQDRLVIRAKRFTRDR